MPILAIHLLLVHHLFIDLKRSKPLSHCQTIYSVCTCRANHAIIQALTKFLKCVNWKQPQESRQGIEFLTRWSPMDVEDALELLSPAFNHPTVRKYAVSRLRQADDQVSFILRQFHTHFGGVGGMNPQIVLWFVIHVENLLSCENNQGSISFAKSGQVRGPCPKFELFIPPPHNLRPLSFNQTAVAFMLFSQ